MVCKSGFEVWVKQANMSLWSNSVQHSPCSVPLLCFKTRTSTTHSVHCGNRNWASKRLTIVAKSTITNPASFLSFLCPLLKLFSVCIHSINVSYIIFHSEFHYSNSIKLSFLFYLVQDTYLIFSYRQQILLNRAILLWRSFLRLL